MVGVSDVVRYPCTADIEQIQVRGAATRGGLAGLYL
jgi:hypothetical protein